MHTLASLFSQLVLKDLICLLCAGIEGGCHTSPVCKLVSRDPTRSCRTHIYPPIYPCCSAVYFLSNYGPVLLEAPSWGSVTRFERCPTLFFKLSWGHRCQTLLGEQVRMEADEPGQGALKSGCGLSSPPSLCQQGLLSTELASWRGLFQNSSPGTQAIVSELLWPERF